MRSPTPEKLRRRAAQHSTKADACRTRAAKWLEEAIGWRTMAKANIAHADYLERLPEHLKANGGT